MKIALYISHPAQYLFFKNPIKKWKEHGHNVKIFIRTKDVLAQLVQNDGLEFENIMPKERKSGVFFITKAFVSRTIKLFFKIVKFNPDILLGTDASIAQIAFLLRKPCITTLEDDYKVIKRLALLTYPFTGTILTPGCCTVGGWRHKQIKYDGFMKLSYLHPAYFQPNEAIRKLSVKNEPYCLIRLSKLTAYHDSGISGLYQQYLVKCIAFCKRYGRNVYISAEGNLTPDLEPNKLAVNPSEIHHILAGADLLISDSQSMTVEAAMLGIPSIRFSDFAGQISVLEELEHRYHLTFGIPTSMPKQLFKLIVRILTLENRSEIYQKRRMKMLSEKIDVSAFVTRFVETYPESKKASGHLDKNGEIDNKISDASDFTLIKYAELIRTLKKQGYAFRTFEEVRRGNNKGRFVILRHDVDTRASHSLQCAEIEHNEGICGSYYFRVVPGSNRPEIIREIVRLGHEIGYHYEDLSLCKGNIQKAIQLFEQNLTYFRQFYPVSTICMHGSPTSRFNNADIWQQHDYHQWNIIGEPYFDLNFMDILYLTDTGRCWNGQSFSIRDKVKGRANNRFTTTNDIIEAAANNLLPSKIMFTVHPQRWTNNQWKWTYEIISQNAKNQIKKLVILLRK